MSLESVRAFLAEKAPDVEVVELDFDTTTASMSAAWRVAPAQVAKCLTLKVGDRIVMLITCGDSRLDNRKLKDELGGKARLLPQAEAAPLTGHQPGGICAFGLAAPLPVYFDIRLNSYDEVVPGAGSPRAALRISPLRMAELVGAQWVDVCSDPGER